MNTIYYDLNPDGQKRPVWLAVELSESMDWNKTLYVNTSEFDTCYVGDFDDGILSCSIDLGELITGRTDTEFGIDLYSVQQRIGDAYLEIERFMILVGDVVEVIAISGSLFEI